MLTVEKLRTYAEFHGDLDGWVRATAGRDRSGMTDADWYLIDELLLGLTAVHAGPASPELVLDVESKVLASTEDSAARAALRALVGRAAPARRTPRG
jgi:hypothetical protein